MILPAWPEEPPLQPHRPVLPPGCRRRRTSRQPNQRAVPATMPREAACCQSTMPTYRGAPKPQPAFCARQVPGAAGGAAAAGFATAPRRPVQLAGGPVPVRGRVGPGRRGRGRDQSAGSSLRNRRLTGRQPWVTGRTSRVNRPAGSSSTPASVSRKRV